MPARYAIASSRTPRRCACGPDAAAARRSPTTACASAARARPCSSCACAPDGAARSAPSSRPSDIRSSAIARSERPPILFAASACTPRCSPSPMRALAPNDSRARRPPPSPAPDHARRGSRRCPGFVRARKRATTNTRNRGAPRVPRGAPNAGFGGHFAALADVPASFARESARLRIREIEERRGFPGALRTLGGLGGHLAALADVPASFARESARLRIREIEERYGFPGALRTLGGLGGHLGAPMWKEWPVACSRLMG